MGELSTEDNRRWLLPLLVAAVGIFMSLLDSSIVAVAISSIMTAFNTDESSVQWVSTAYLLALGVSTPLSGWLGDRLGLKNLYLGALATFLAGSLLCSLSWNISVLLFARVLQGLGGGMINPSVLAMIYKMVPRKSIGTAMGIFGLAGFIAPALGPTVGGYLVEYINWQWIFTINLPIGILGIIAAYFLLPEFKAKGAGRLDIAGALTSTIMLYCLLFALSKGQDWGWLDERTVLFFAVSLIAFALFVAIELSSDNPLLDLRVFKYRSFTLGSLVIIVSMVGLFVGTFYFPLYLQKGVGLDAMETGLIMTPAALVSAVLMLVSGTLYDKVGPKPLTLLGLSLLALLTFQFHTLSLTTPISTVMLWITLRGAVSPFTNMPSQTAAMSDIPTELVGRASALTNVIARIASSFGLAVLTSLFSGREMYHQAQYAWSLKSFDPTVQFALGKISSLLGGGSKAYAGTLALLAGKIGKLSFIDSLEDMFFAVGIFTLAGIIPAFFLKKKEES